MKGNKLLLRFPFVLLAVLALNACHRDSVDDYLSASSDKVEIVNGRGQVTIHSNVKWNVTWTSEWLNCPEKEGQGEKLLQFTAEENPDTTERSGTLTVKNTAGTLAVNINVWQKGTPVPPDPDEITLNAQTSAELSVAAAEGKSGVTVSANNSWTMSRPEYSEGSTDWISFKDYAPNTAYEKRTVFVEMDIKENTTVSERSAVITFTCGKASARLTVKQAKAGEFLTVDNQTSTSVTFDKKDADSKTFSVESNVSWEVNSDESWCTVSPKSGSNNGTVTVNVTANPSSTERTATVTVKGGGITRTVKVTQAGGIVLLVNNSTSTTVNFDKKDASSKTFSVESNVSWEVSSDQSWCTVSPKSGSNNGTVTVNVTANTGSTERKATVTVKGGGITRTVTVTQAGEIVLLVNNSTSTTVNFDKKDASSKTFSVESNVSWEVSSDQNWCTVSPKSGSNNGTVTVNVTANPNSTERKATVKVTGGGITRTATVTQAGEAFLTVDNNTSTTVTFDKENADSKNFSIESNVSWDVNSDQNWCTVSPSSGKDYRTVTVYVTANPNSTQRTATVTVTGGNITRYVTVTQAAAEEKYLRVYEENSFSFDRKSSISNFRIESNVSWTINRSSLPDWLTLTQYFGSNDARVSATVKPNNDEGPRYADITVSGDGVASKTIHVSQTGVTLSISPGQLELDGEGNSKSMTINCNGDWTINYGDYPSWCTIASSSRSGSGTKTIYIAAEKNTGEERYGTITVTSGNVRVSVKVSQKSGKVVPGENDNPLPQYSRKKK